MFKELLWKFILSISSSNEANSNIHKCSNYFPMNRFSGKNQLVVFSLNVITWRINVGSILLTEKFSPRYGSYKTNSFDSYFVVFTLTKCARWNPIHNLLFDENNLFGFESCTIWSMPILDTYRAIEMKVYATIR